MTRNTAPRFVTTDPQILGGEPIIAGTRTPVRAVVELRRSGITPEEIVVDLPHLSLVQVIDSLSYYSEHTAEIDRYIEANRFPGLGEFDSGETTVSERAEEILRKASAASKWRAGQAGKSR